MSILITLATLLGVWYLRSNPGVLPGEPPPAPVEKPREEARGGLQDPLPQTDERFRVPGVDEPEMPTTEEAAKKAGYTTLKGGGYLFERADGVEGVAVPATFLVGRGVIELVGCGAGGKEHESVVRLDCDLHSLDAALTLCGFRRGRLPKELQERSKEIGDRLVVLIQWKQNGKVVTHRAEDLILHVNREAPMPRLGWTYVGEWIEVPDPSSTPREKKSYKVLAAAATRSLITTWRGLPGLLNNPYPPSVDDSLYAANYVLAPRPGTPVTVILRAPNAREREEIAKAEKELK